MRQTTHLCRYLAVSLPSTQGAPLRSPEDKSSRMPSPPIFSCHKLLSQHLQSHGASGFSPTRMTSSGRPRRGGSLRDARRGAGACQMITGGNRRRRRRDYSTSAWTSLTAVITWMRSSGVGEVMRWASRTWSMKWPMSVRMSGPCSTCSQPEKTSSHLSSLVILIHEEEQEPSHSQRARQISELRHTQAGRRAKTVCGEPRIVREEEMSSCNPSARFDCRRTGRPPAAVRAHVRGERSRCGRPPGRRLLRR